MIRSCGDEEEITSLECFALTFVKQYAPTPEDDEVDLVLCVRGLLVRGQRPREVNVEATAPQKIDRPLPVRTWDARLSLCEVDYAAAVWLAHAHLLVLPNP
jgi:hypothetical protein